jgi:hypothetical protein
MVKKLTNKAFKAIILRIWRPGGRVVFNEIQENLWLFKFSEESDKHKVLAERPSTYDRTLLILNDFDGQIPPSQLDFSSSPIWIQIHDIPLGCMNRPVGNQIGNFLEVEDVAVVEEDVGWRRYLQVRVEINLYQPLLRGRSLIISGKSCWVSFKYKKLPRFCFRCGKIIHGSKGCHDPIMRKTSHNGGSEGWGLWLRADDLSRCPANGDGQKTT